MTIELKDLLWYLALGLFFFLMMRRGGCCGGHRRERKYPDNTMTKGE